MKLLIPKKNLLHNEYLHDSEENISSSKYFGDVLLVPGPGHIEKNFLLTIFKFTKDIFMFKLADKLGFKSLKAKDFIVNCADHHLSWQIATIVFDAFAKELIYVYIQYCEKENLDPSIEHLVSWRNEKVTQTLILIFTTI